MVFDAKSMVFVAKKMSSSQKRWSSLQRKSSLSQSKTFWGKDNLLCRKAKRFGAKTIFFVAKQNVLRQRQSSLSQSKKFRRKDDLLRCEGNDPCRFDHGLWPKAHRRGAQRTAQKGFLHLFSAALCNFNGNLILRVTNRRFLQLLYSRETNYF